MKIIVTPRAYDYHAQVEGTTGGFVAPDAETAIGMAVITNQNQISGLEIEIKDPTAEVQQTWARQKEATRGHGN